MGKGNTALEAPYFPLCPRSGRDAIHFPLASSRLSPRQIAIPPSPPRPLPPLPLPLLLAFAHPHFGAKQREREMQTFANRMVFRRLAFFSTLVLDLVRGRAVLIAKFYLNPYVWFPAEYKNCVEKVAGTGIVQNFDRPLLCSLLNCWTESWTNGQTVFERIGNWSTVRSVVPPTPVQISPDEHCNKLDHALCLCMVGCSRPLPSLYILKRPCLLFRIRCLRQ